MALAQVRCCAVLTSAFSQKTGELKPDGSLNRAFIMKQNKSGSLPLALSINLVLSAIILTT
jgi:hypothetical protein